MTIHDFNKFSWKYVSNTGEWRLKDKDGNLHDMKVVDMLPSGDIIFEFVEHS